MVSGWWDRPVPVLVGSSTTHHVTRPGEAADLLLHDWPEYHGPAYEQAKDALLKAMENPDSESLRAASRSAFESAARESGILVE